uniref:XK-related protein n=1 Tax=Cyprinus carpio TaxID=7962 RepID=A0A8C2HDA4_CYPCA
QETAQLSKFWLKYDRDLKDFESQASAGNVVFFSGAKRVKLLLVLHVFQLGFFIRHISAIWGVGFHVWWQEACGSAYAVYLTHDLSMLRLMETFCERTPQLTLMMYIMLHSNHARLVQCGVLIFMDSPAGEWLYRATVGLIWYFSWLDMAEGHTRGRSLIYHTFLIIDTSILLATWWLYHNAERNQLHAFILIISIPLSYVLGMLIKFLYYCFTYDVTDGVEPPVDIKADSASVQTIKRMGRHAANFYTTNTSSAIKTNECEAANSSVQ